MAPVGVVSSSLAVTLGAGAGRSASGGGDARRRGKLGLLDQRQTAAAQFDHRQRQHRGGERQAE